MKLPKSIQDLIDSFERLPGIGSKSAQRLAFYLLHFPKEELEKFSDALIGLKTHTKLCEICKNVSEDDICAVCSNPSRNKYLIAVVSSALDAFALEKTGFKGSYHILHGIIDPLNNIGPEEIFIKELVDRLNNLTLENQVEIILATSTSMEGESTAMYITKLIRNSGYSSDIVKVSRIARGLPVGGDIEYADDNTLSKALDGRIEV